VDVKGRGMEKWRGCIEKGDGEGGDVKGRGMEEGVASCLLCPRCMGVLSLRTGVLIMCGCTRRVGVHSSSGGGIIARGWNHRVRVYWSCGGVLVAQGWNCRVRVMWPSWLPFVWWHLVRQEGNTYHSSTDSGRNGQE
jgi:hypothetical protein